jgi:hypothetical protein
LGDEGLWFILDYAKGWQAFRDIGVGIIHHSSLFDLQQATKDLKPYAGEVLGPQIYDTIDEQVTQPVPSFSSLFSAKQRKNGYVAHTKWMKLQRLAFIQAQDMSGVWRTFPLLKDRAVILVRMKEAQKVYPEEAVDAHASTLPAKDNAMTNTTSYPDGHDNE